MGTVYTDITLKNAEDEMKAKIGILPADKVRTVKTRALVDTGAWTLVLSEETCNKLGLEKKEASYVNLAGGQNAASVRASLVKVEWENRSMTCDPVVLPGEKEDILGAIPMEAMDLIVSPARLAVVGAHGDKMVFRV